VVIVGRARPLAVEDRQSMIIDAVIPLLLEHGRAVTSKQIADAAGIAEGTVFRAFGDKDSLISAALDRFFDPEPLRRELRSIDASLPLEDKVRTIITILRERFRGVIGMMSVIGDRGHPKKRPETKEYEGIIAVVLAPDAAAIGWSGEQVAQLLRLVSFSVAMPGISNDSFTVDELTHIVLYGITGVHPEKRRN
jgi:AcrR family transcriptional regulator